MSFSSFAQSLEQYRWEDRLLLIYAQDLRSAQVEQQIEILKDREAALQERKLRVFRIGPEDYIEGLDGREKKHQHPQKLDRPFLLVLIGLDGGEKFSAERVTPLETIIGLIDRMPMRRAEIRSKGK